MADDLQQTELMHIEDVCIQFEEDWKLGKHPSIEAIFESEAPCGEYLLYELLVLELHYRRRSGDSPTEEEYGQRFSRHSDVVFSAFRDTDSQDRDTVDFANARALETTFRQGDRVGAYTIEQRIGAGGFGAVYRARGSRSGETVAIKLAKRSLSGSNRIWASFANEAQLAITLDHPSIVRIFEIDHLEDGTPFVVMEFVAGRSLKELCETTQLSSAAAIDLVIQCADAIGHAHQQGVFHRDLKPANILIDPTGRPRLVDFGLAIHESVQREHAGEFVGTMAYMSPEQVRGETHRLDGRTDIWALGAILYELLMARKPFGGDTKQQLIDEILHREPRPLRQVVGDAVSREHERICLKALAKRVNDRYGSALDMADELRQSLATAAPQVNEVPPVIPRGLRSFDNDDAAFFQRLLPGPRGRNGVPECLLFWKTRIEAQRGEAQRGESQRGESQRGEAGPAIGLICGPSGCGKTSLVQAGLLPILANFVITIRVVAEPANLEKRLHDKLRSLFPTLAATKSLAEAMTRIRNGEGPPPRQKVLIVVDQFEQWLHMRDEVTSVEFVDALRQCDGNRVQCLIVVRDDFWMAITRFFRDLDIPLVDGQNMATVDRFDPRHARFVLAEFASAYGCLTDRQGSTEEADQFLDLAVKQLAQDGKVAPIQLSLLAEMIKSEPWTPSRLRELNGVDGIAMAFFERHLTSQAVNPEHRRHVAAARRVLAALLPPLPAAVGRTPLSRQELRAASDYGERDGDFESLLRMLENELRLLTPVDAEAETDDPRSQLAVAATERHYTLQHDYLIHPLRRWLARKLGETRRGRAELLLKERDELWKSKPETRQLPGWWEWSKIVLWTQGKHWTPSQRQMMRAAAASLATRTAIVSAVIVAIAGGLWITFDSQRQRRASDHAGNLVRQLRDAELVRLPPIIDELDSHRTEAEPHLRRALEQERTAEEQLRFRLALLPVDIEQVEPVFDRLVDAEPAEIRVLREVVFNELPTSHGRLAATYLQSILNRSSDRGFGMNLLWPDAEPAVIREIEAAEGTINASCAFCQTMQLEAFFRLAPRLGDAKYRPVRVRPFRHAGDTLVAAVWVRDNFPWRMAHGLTRDELQRADHGWRGQGFRAADVFGYVNEHDGQPSYGALWVDANGPAEDQLLIVGASPLPYAARSEELRGSGFRQTCLSSLAMADNELLVNAIWTPASSPGETSFSRWNEDHPDYFADLAGLEEIHLTSADPDSDDDVRYTGQLALAEQMLAKHSTAAALFLRGRANYYLSHYEAAVTDLSDLVERHPDYETHALPFRALAYARLAEDDNALRDLATCQRILPRPNRVWSQTYRTWLQTSVLTLLGQHQEGLKHIEALVEEFPGDPLPSFYAGCCYSVASEVVVEREPDVARRYADQAVEHLSNAMSNGFSEPTRLHTTPDLAPLRQRPDFQTRFARSRVPIRYAALWSGREDFMTRELHGLNPADHLDRARGLIEAGFRPASISVASTSSSGTLTAGTVWHLDASGASDVRRASRLANAAAALLRLDPTNSSWRLMQHSEHPLLRTCLINRLSVFGVRPQTIMSWMAQTSDVSTLRALILALGDFDPARVEADERRMVAARLDDLFRSHPDAGVHASAAWTLRRWGRQDVLEQLNKQLSLQSDTGNPAMNWHVNRELQTMVTIEGPNEFSMGSPGDETHRGTSETQHRRRIGRSFAISAYEVTVDQMQRYLSDFSPPKRFAEPDLPAFGVTWYQAAGYCNWLSEREGIDRQQWCYVANGDGEFAQGMRLADNFHNLAGYRLPTEAEWEFACRAGTRDAWSFGSSVEMLSEYGWHYANSQQRPWSVGLLKPNDLGLFDMHGNALEWCQDQPRPYRAGDDTDGAGEEVNSADKRITRGGSFGLAFLNCRSAARLSFLPTSKSQHGLRVARTIKPFDARSAEDAISKTRSPARMPGFGS